MDGVSGEDRRNAIGRVRPSVCFHFSFATNWSLTLFFLLAGKWNTHTHTHTHPFNGPFSGTTRVSRYQEGKTNLDFTEARDSGSGISWAICKSAPRSRQTTTPAPHHSVFYRPDAIPAAQPTASMHWRLGNEKQESFVMSKLSTKMCALLHECLLWRLVGIE